MATNPFFNSFNANNEQSLIASLVTESIQQKGYDIYYLPRRAGNLNDILNTDDMSTFDTAYEFEMYIKNVEGFGGDGNFLSKFGLEIRDRIILTLSRSRFEEAIAAPERVLKPSENMTRPREGDLIYFGLVGKMFEIMNFDKYVDYYPLGSLPMHDVHCEMFEYSNEVFNTGIPAIDQIYTKYSSDQVPYYEYDSNDDPVFDANGDNVLIDYEPETINPDYDNEDIDEAVRPSINFTIIDPRIKRL